MASELKIKSDDEYSLSAINTTNEVINVVVRKCLHCNEMVPIVGICSDCSTDMNTKYSGEPGNRFYPFYL